MNHGQPVDPEAKRELANSIRAVQNAFAKVANKVARNLVTEARTDPVLYEALQTKQLPNNAVQVGSYAVFPIPNKNGKNRFDVANQTTGEKLVGDLYLAESAQAIVKLLNKNYSFYSPQIRQILEFETMYVKHFNDALTFKRKVKNNPVRDQLLESRFENAKEKALLVKEQLLDYLKKI